MTDHPLTDEIIYTMWGKGDPSHKFEKRLARSAADWQLERVFEWLDDYPVQDVLEVWGISGLIKELKQAMRPQEQRDVAGRSLAPVTPQEDN